MCHLNLVREAVTCLDDVLRVEELRAGFLRYTREAYARLPAMSRPRILDIGCGSGLPTMELARLSGGEVIGVDTNVSSLAKLGSRIEGSDLQHRVKAINVSFFATDFADESFDVLWDEGVLHLFDPEESLPVCRRLLRPDGVLVMNETVMWLESIMAQLRAHEFDVGERIPLPPRSWWTDYYAPLEARIQELRAREGVAAGAERLAKLEGEIAIVKANPERFDCCFLILEKS